MRRIVFLLCVLLWAGAAGAQLRSAARSQSELQSQSQSQALPHVTRSQSRSETLQQTRTQPQRRHTTTLPQPRAHDRYRYNLRGHNSPLERASLAGVEYHNFARTWQKIDLAEEDMLIFSPVVRGIAFTTGHSFLLHEKPLLKVFHFGFDATWFDFGYGNWRHKVDGHGKWMHKIDAAIGAGPALHISPWRRFGIHTYIRYNPTLSIVAHNFAGDTDGKFELVAGYASYFSTGLALSWDAFSVGGEYLHGGGTYRGIRIPDVTVSPDNIDDLLDLDIKDALDKQRHTMRGWRAYISFRF